MNREVVDQFAGPGGWDLAARWLGLDPLGIENDAAACATREAAGLRTISEDIRKVEPIPAWGLISSPPCPTFSAAGKGSGRKELPVVIDIAKRLVAGEDWRLLTAGLEDERTGLVLEPLHWIIEMHRAGTPYRWVALEQVPAVLPVWQLYADILREMGYSAWTGKLTSEMYGVPQTRVRAILVASLDREVTAPPPTHSKFYSRDRTRLDPGVRKWVSMAEALGWGMTERPYPVLAMSRTTGGPDKEKVGGSKARAIIYDERDAGRWQMLSAGRTSPQTAGVLPRDVDDPSATLTGKGTAVWLVNNTSEKAGVGSTDEPAPTVYFGERLNKMTWQLIPEGMVTVKGEGMLERAGQQQSQRSIDEPALTMTGAEGGGSHRHRWQYRNSGPGAARDPRPVDEAPSYTIRANGSGSHPSGVEWASERPVEPVRVSHIEAAVLQGFPADYPWQGTKTKKHQQIGNAIPPPLAYHVLAMATGIPIAIDVDSSEGEFDHRKADSGLVVSTGVNQATVGPGAERNRAMSEGRWRDIHKLQERSVDAPAPTVDGKVGGAWRIHRPGQRHQRTGDEEQVTDQQQAPASPANEKWLTPKASKDAKAYGADLGHRIGRFTVKNNVASAKCKLCGYRLEVVKSPDGDADVQIVNPAGERGDLRCGDETPAEGDGASVTNPPPVSEAYAQAKTAEDAMKQRIAEARARFDAGLSSPDALLMSNAADSSPAQPTSQSVLMGDGGQYLGELVAQEANELLMSDAGGGWTAPTSEQLHAWPEVVHDPNVAPGVMQQGVRWTMPPPLPMDDYPVLDPNGQPWDPFAELIGMIERFTEIDERSQQKLIGPSEIGLDCDRCLAKKLMQIPITREVAWLPAIGRAVHSWLEHELKKCGDDCGWTSERKVPIGIIGNRLIKGTCDAFKNGVVVDFKVVGDTTLKKVRAHGASAVYRGQGHSYGRGYELEGHTVTHVMVLYLPRNAPSLSAAEKHIEPYSREIAAGVLERAQGIYNAVTADPSMLIKLPRAADCYDCYRFAPLPGEDQAVDNQPRAGKPFAGILAP